MPQSVARYKIFGVPIDAITIAETVGRLFDSENRYVVFYANAEALVRAARDEKFSLMLNFADLVFPDGIGLKLASVFLGARFKRRIAGVDLISSICERASKTGWGVFFLGGKNGVAEKASLKLTEKFPGLQVSGFLDGYGDLSRWKHDGGIHSAEILFVGLGSPLQEEWIVKYAGDLPGVKIIMAVGGAFDMISGGIPRAPVFLRKIGLEWLWRFLMEPRKRFWRMINAVIVFPIMVILRNGFTE